MKPAVECVSSPSRPSDDLPSSRAATSSGSVTTSYVDAEHELARVQDERLVVLGLDQPGQLGLLLRRVDVRVAVVLEHPEERSRRTSMLDGCTICSSYGSSCTRPAAISARMSRSVSSTRLRLPTPGSAVVAQAGVDRRLRGARPERQDRHARLRSGRRVRGCSSMAEHQLPKLTVRVRFPSPAPGQRPDSRTYPHRIPRSRVYTPGPADRPESQAAQRHNALLRPPARSPARQGDLRDVHLWVGDLRRQSEGPGQPVQGHRPALDREPALQRSSATTRPGWTRAALRSAARKSPRSASRRRLSRS